MTIVVGIIPLLKPFSLELLRNATTSPLVLFLIFLAFTVSAEDWGKGIGIVVLGVGFIAIAFFVMKFFQSEFFHDLSGLIKNLIEIYF